MRRNPRLVLLIALVIASAALGAGPKKVTFNAEGNFVVDGRPFFPLGIWLYDASPQVLAEVQSKGFNLAIGNGFAPHDLDAIAKHGMMAVPFATPEFLAGGIKHPALLAWYVTDEPEGHGVSPEQVKQQYQELKAKDPNHPAGLCHFLYDAFPKYKDACDFTMSDVYPVTANRDVPLRNVGIHMDQARAVQPNANQPVLPFIQIFGGPDTDGGKWAQPEPKEVRCMTFIGLVHRANAMLFFSYWAKAPVTWASVGELNRDLKHLIPWLLAKGDEIAAKSSDEGIQVRARKVGDGWMIIAVNVERKPIDATLSITGLGNIELQLPFEKRSEKAHDGNITAHFDACQEHVYLFGPQPKLINEK